MSLDLGFMRMNASVRPPHIVTNTWTVKAPRPIGYINLSLAALDGKLYATGGQDRLGNIITDMHEYDPVADTWTSMAPLPVSNTAHASVGLNGKLYVMGGTPNNSVAAVQATVRVWTKATNTWALGPAMPVVRSGFGAAAIGGKIYIAGGSNNVGSGVLHTSAYVLDPGTGIWTAIANIPTPRSAPAYGELGGKLALWGGNLSSGLSATAVLFDPVAGTWSTTASNSASRGGWPAGGGLDDGNFYVCGGFNVTDSNATFRYTTSLNSWITRANMPFGFSGISGAVLDGLLYVVGGRVVTSANPTYLQVYS